MSNLTVALIGMTMLAASGGVGQAESTPPAPHLVQSGLDIRFELDQQRLRQISMTPGDLQVSTKTGASEVEIQVTGRNAPGHHAKKLIEGNPGSELRYAGQSSEDTPLGRHVTIRLQAADLHLDVESHYQFITGVPVVRRWVRLVNHGAEPIGLEHVSSAMLYNIANFGDSPLEKKLTIHYAYNSWMSEGQWQAVPPSKLGLSDNGNFNLTAMSLGNLGSWSTMWFLPMGMVENHDVGTTWFWQIEHNGAWHWEMSNTGSNTSYIYLGGPDEMYANAWKNLGPGASYETVPVVVGAVRGGFDEAVAALTAYRRKACLQKHPDNEKCPVVFNDYMNCLRGDPTAEREAPLIDAAAAAGCEYFVIDAGWYAEVNAGWWDSVGMWEPSKSRWPGGIKKVLDSIRAKGMVPGLWLEIEVAGINSPLKDKPDAWFFMRHGRRVIHNGRFFLDYRNPEVQAYADGVIDRLVKDLGAGYFKIDYNVDALLGTERDADSFGQGLLEHQRSYLQWIDRVHRRHPDLVIENCGSGGGRMDYAMLSHHQLQSVSDQENYLKNPAIVSGSLAGVLPEQLAGWSYPLAQSDADGTSFNMINSMLGRIFLSGQLADLNEESRREVIAAIDLYKRRLRPEIPKMTPFWPLGRAAMSDPVSPVAVGLRGAEHSFVSVWRVDGPETVTLPNSVGRRITVLYPTGRGIEAKATGNGLEVHFPRPRMAALVEVQP